MDKLTEIIQHKQQEIAPIIPLTDKLRASALTRNTFSSLHAALMADEAHLGLIAEVKRASPSAGTISENFDPIDIALAYQAAGASAISVLTDEKYFGGKLPYLSQIADLVDIPVLRKDFIIHEAQIYEASVAGADAVLLIVAALEQDRLKELLEVTHNCGLEALVEVHNIEEMERALQTDAIIIGVNNRNLKTFEVDLETTRDLVEEVGTDIVFVSESGIKTPEDAALIGTWGADAILVGETLMRADDTAAMVAALMAPRELGAVDEDEA